MTHTIEEIANALGLEPRVTTDLRSTASAEPAMPGRDELALAMKPEYAERWHRGRARAAMLWDGADWRRWG